MLVKTSRFVSVLFLLFLFAGCDGGFDSNSNGQVDQGKLETFDPEKNSINDVAILNLNTVFDTGVNAKIAYLKACNDSKCWTLFDQEDSAQRRRKVAVAQKLTMNKSTENLGSFVIKEEEITIDSLKYLYKGKEGKIKLDNGITFLKSTSNDIYLNLDDDINVALSSLSLPHLGANYFLHKEHFKREIEGGVIVDIEEGSSLRSSFVYADVIGGIKTQEVEIDSHIINFYLFPSSKDLSAIDNVFSSNFLKPINIFIPIRLFNLSVDEVKNKYKLTVNDVFVDYNIISFNNKHFISFKTIETTIKVIVYEEKRFLQ